MCLIDVPLVRKSNEEPLLIVQPNSVINAVPVLPAHLINAEYVAPSSPAFMINADNVAPVAPEPIPDDDVTSYISDNEKENDSTKPPPKLLAVCKASNRDALVNSYNNNKLQMVLHR